ncbi:hypothetical protein BDP27DRAFT_1327277 [Rhodocollybia butyracea]|uniref:Thioredoxin domain-containing protein n=1 Tax=Rhodocollybia butyracea TaxID=206335 RepID=A0A9P5PS76_9AGAR|nr:hypothetical protein BDP27DRAFT_1327277 [Rhodocollybia butyracea]
MLEPEGFQKALEANETVMVAFVAPGSSDCQRMAPEYSKGALGLYPSIPSYAVDCDADTNKHLCAEQGATSLPTVKLFPRGNTLDPVIFDGERTSSGFFYWASRGVPNHIKRIRMLDHMQPWVDASAESGLPRALLLTKEKMIPLLWTVLGNKYAGQIELAYHRDRKGKTSVVMGLEPGEDKTSKVLIYAPGSTTFMRYQGLAKIDSLSKFFDSIVDGTADLETVNAQAAAEEFVPDEAELEIERKQEAQRIALLHGGFADLIDFEEALKSGINPHGSNSQGYPGMMGDMPKKEPEESGSRVEMPETGTMKKSEEQAASATSHATAEAPKDEL